ncbi:hypothetical protein [Clostridium sp. CMCC3677]|uniref:hypothetical protein n=1 Tax=Clostridium sp. CMCC3677 TaxID=2949963 RepID=UPI0013F0743C|nr:hypothetical protein [Clostridium sp. CMCC3677]NFG60526.1 hypothetical protein [Clostridium botulinum]NFQ09831.1 hypothetical protein [Clostridium botulinum]
MTIEEIKQQLDFLSDKIDLINTNIQFNITTFLAILAIAIALTGAALVLLVRNIVSKRFNEEIKNIDDQRDKKIEQATDKINEIIFNKDELLGYEKGSWTPKLQLYGWGDYKYYFITNGAGTYVKQGDIININLYITAQITDEIRAEANNVAKRCRVIIDGLPFTASPYMYRSCSLGVCEGINTEEGQLVAEIIPTEDVPTQIEFGLINKNRLRFLELKELSEFVTIKVSAIYSTR